MRIGYIAYLILRITACAGGYKFRGHSSSFRPKNPLPADRYCGRQQQLILRRHRRQGNDKKLLFLRVLWREVGMRNSVVPAERILIEEQPGISHTERCC